MEESKDFPACFHRVTIKGLCVRDGKLLMIREAKTLSGKWELPGGGLDFGEEIKEAFGRETAEEMGLKVRRMSENPVYAWTHRYENKRKMEWFYSLVLAYRVEFEDLNISPTAECEAIEFFSKDELISLNLSGQMSRLAPTFNPEDFTESF
jgi:8-oxo-dGTP diphosphatase